MKKLLLVAIAIAISFSFVSCKKCVTCKYKYDYKGQTQEVSYPQECGTSKQIKDFKANVESDAKLHGVSSTCTTN